MTTTLGRLAVVTLATAALLAPALPANAIVGGAPDAGEHPYVGQLLFYVPDAVDPRFDDPAIVRSSTVIALATQVPYRVLPLALG